MRIPKGSTGELVTEMLGTVKMNLLLNFNSTEYYQPGDTLPGKTNAGLMGAAEEKLVPQIEQMLPKMDSILYSLNKILADPALSATLHNAEKPDSQSGCDNTSIKHVNAKRIFRNLLEN